MDIMKVFSWNSHLFIYSVIHLIIYVINCKLGTVLDTEDQNIHDESYMIVLEIMEYTAK